MLDVKFVRVRPTAKAPVRGSDKAAGLDFFADLGIGETVTLFPGRRHTFPLGISMSIPDGWYLQLKPRSGLAHKQGIMTLAGVIDSDFTGEIKAIIYNSGDTKFEVAHGDKIIQGVFLPVPDVSLEEVKQLDATVRGDGGFGSTGK